MSDIWVEDTFERILPEQAAKRTRRIRLTTTRGEVVSLQVGVRPSRTVVELQCKVTGSAAGHTLVRLAELVPLRHHTTDVPVDLLEGHAPGFVPDPLVPYVPPTLSANQSRAIWLTVRLPRGTKRADLAIELSDASGSLGKVAAQIDVLPIDLPEPTLPTTNWFYSDALCDWYKVEPLSVRYWELVERYMGNMVEHGQTAIYTPLFTPPLDKEKRDLQLVEVTVGPNGKYRFGWRNVQRWLRAAKDAGFRYFEMSHLFSQWGCKYAIRILGRRNGASDAQPLWPKETPAMSEASTNFMRQFLPALVKFLKGEGVFEQSLFHLSDEPHAEHLDGYRAVREFVRSVAPEIRVTEALSNVEFAEAGLVDRPVPIISSIDDFRKKGIGSWAYFCCGPHGTYTNRFLDYPLYRNRVLGLQLYRFGLQGFLHWGLNYWYRFQTTQMIDPYHVTDGMVSPRLPAGDMFLVYPGADGPVDSIRWEAFRDAMTDYRLLQAAEARAGATKVARLLKEIESTARFPQSPDYLRKVRRAAMKLALGPANAPVRRRMPSPLSGGERAIPFL